MKRDWFAAYREPEKQGVTGGTGGTSAENTDAAASYSVTPSSSGCDTERKRWNKPTCHQAAQVSQVAREVEHQNDADTQGFAEPVPLVPPVPPANHHVVELPTQDDFEERAALVEYGAGVPREWAEGFALLHPDRPPAGVPRDRWQRFVDVAGKFLDRGYAAQAAALGWGPLELFGCDATKPAVCIDLQGLLWLIPEGARLVTLTADAATLRMSTGAIQTYRRMSTRGAVLAWELEVSP